MKPLSFFSDAVALRNFDVGLYCNWEYFKLSFFHLREDPELLEIRKRAFPDIKFYISSGFFEVLSQGEDALKGFDWFKYSEDYLKFLQDNKEFIDFAEALLPYTFSPALVDLNLEHFERITDFLVYWPLDQGLQDLRVMKKYVVSIDTRFFESFPLDQISSLAQANRTRIHLAEIGAKYSLYFKCANLYSVDSGGWISPTRYSLMPCCQQGVVETVPLSSYTVRGDFSTRVGALGLPAGLFFEPNLSDTKLDNKGLEVSKWHTLSAIAWTEMNFAEYPVSKINYFTRLAPSEIHGLPVIQDDLMLALAHIDEQVSVKLSMGQLAVLADIQNKPQQRLLEDADRIQQFILKVLNAEYPVDSESIQYLNVFIAAMLAKKIPFPETRSDTDNEEALKSFNRKFLPRLDALLEFVKAGSLILRNDANDA
jgi:hypothetical protein